jgi:rSAM/selenodomain-associated transferase 2
MPSLSLILPALNEASLVQGALARLEAQAPDAERILVDGGSSDGTALLAAPHARVIVASRGRAVQMNRGAEASNGDWLLFLHLDTRLPDGFPAEVARAAVLGFKAGAFRLRIAGRHPLLPLLGWGATLRTRVRGIALGDQALFCSRALFQSQGGFPALPLMEDYAFTLGLRRAGIPLYLARTAVVTAGRRWDEEGFWRTWWRFRRFYHRFGREPELARLAREYRDVR